MQNLALPFAAISFGTISNDRQNDLISKRISRSVFKTTKAFLDKSLYLNRPGMFSLCFTSHRRNAMLTKSKQVPGPPTLPIFY